MIHLYKAVYTNEELFDTSGDVHDLQKDREEYYVHPKDVFENEKACFSYFSKGQLIRIYFTPVEKKPPVVNIHIRKGLRNQFDIYKEFENKRRRSLNDFHAAEKKEQTTEMGTFLKAANHYLLQLPYQGEHHTLSISTNNFTRYEDLNEKLRKENVNLLGSPEVDSNVVMYGGNSIIKQYDILNKQDELLNVFTQVKTAYTIENPKQAYTNDPMKIRIVLYLASLGFYCNYHFHETVQNGTSVYQVLNVDFRKPDDATCKQWAKSYRESVFLPLYESVEESIGKTFGVNASLPSFETPLPENEFKKLFSFDVEETNPKPNPKTKPKTKPKPRITTPSSIPENNSPLADLTLSIPFASAKIKQLLGVSANKFWTLLEDMNHNEHCIYVFDNTVRNKSTIVHLNMSQLCLFEGQVYGLNHENRVCHIHPTTFKETPLSMTFHSIFSCNQCFVGIIKDDEDTITQIVTYRGNLTTPVAVLSSAKGYYKTAYKVCEFVATKWVQDLSDVVDVYANATHVYLLCPPHVVIYENETGTFRQTLYKLPPKTKSDGPTEADLIKVYIKRQNQNWQNTFTTYTLKQQQYLEDTFGTKQSMVKANIKALEKEIENLALQKKEAWKQKDKLAQLKVKLYEMSGEGKSNDDSATSTEESTRLTFIIDEHTIVDGAPHGFKSFDDATFQLELQRQPTRCTSITQKKKIKFTKEEKAVEFYIEKYDRETKGKGIIPRLDAWLSDIRDEAHKARVREAILKHSIAVPKKKDNPQEPSGEKIPIEDYIRKYDEEQGLIAAGKTAPRSGVKYQIAQISDDVYKKEVQNALAVHIQQLSESKGEDEKQSNEHKTTDGPKLKLKLFNASEKTMLLKLIERLTNEISMNNFGISFDKVYELKEKLLRYKEIINETPNLSKENSDKIKENLTKIITYLKSQITLRSKKGGGPPTDLVTGEARYFDHETRCLYRCHFYHFQMHFEKVDFPISVFKPPKPVTLKVRNTQRKEKEAENLTTEEIMELKEQGVIDVVPKLKKEIENFETDKPRLQRQERIGILVREIVEIQKEPETSRKATFFKNWLAGTESETTMKKEENKIEELRTLVSLGLSEIERKTEDEKLNMNRVRTHLRRDYKVLTAHLLPFIETPPVIPTNLSTLKRAYNEKKTNGPFSEKDIEELNAVMTDLIKKFKDKIFKEVYQLNDAFVKDDLFPETQYYVKNIVTFLQQHKKSAFLKDLKEVFETKQNPDIIRLDEQSCSNLLRSLNEKINEITEYEKFKKKLDERISGLKSAKETVNKYWETKLGWAKEVDAKKKAAEKEETRKANLQQAKKQQEEKEFRQQNLKEDVGESTVDKNSVLTNLAIFFGDSTDPEEAKYRDTVLIPLFEQKYAKHPDGTSKFKTELRKKWDGFIKLKNLQRVNEEVEASPKNKTKKKTTTNKLTFEYKFLVKSPATKSEDTGKGKGKGTKKKMALRGKGAAVPLELAFLFCNEDPCFITERVENMLLPYEEKKPRGLNLETITNVAQKTTDKITADLASVIQNPNVLKAYVTLKYAKTTKEGSLSEKETEVVPLNNHPLYLRIQKDERNAVMERKIMFREELLYHVQLFQCNYDVLESKPVYALMSKSKQPTKKTIDKIVTLAIESAFKANLKDAIVLLRNKLEQQKVTMTFENKLNLFLLECDKYNRLTKAFHEKNDELALNDNDDPVEVKSYLVQTLGTMDNVKRYILGTYFKDKESKPRDWKSRFFETPFPKEWGEVLREATTVFKSLDKFESVSF